MTRSTSERTLMLSIIPSKRHNINGPHKSQSLLVLECHIQDKQQKSVLQDFAATRLPWVQHLHQFCVDGFEVSSLNMSAVAAVMADICTYNGGGDGFVERINVRVSKKV